MATLKNFILVALLFIFAFIYSIVLPLTLAKKKSKAADTYSNIHDFCLLGCGDNNVFCQDCTSTKGQDYYKTNTGEINLEKEKNLKDCVLTFWGFTHYILYSVLGFIAPKYALIFFLVGVGFELYEYKYHGFEDCSDIFWNLMGLITGTLVNQEWRK